MDKLLFCPRLRFGSPRAATGAVSDPANMPTKTMGTNHSITITGGACAWLQLCRQQRPFHGTDPSAGLLWEAILAVISLSRAKRSAVS